MLPFLWQTIDTSPDLLSLHAAQPARYPFLLESASRDIGQNNERNRYDILFAFPEEMLVLTSSGHLTMDGHPIQEGDFLHRLDHWLKENRWFGEEQRNVISSPSLPFQIPFQGGWFLYLGYELAGQVEPVLQPRLAGNAALNAASIEAGFPIAFASRIPAAIIRDKRAHRTILVAEPHRAPCLAEMKKDLLSVGSTWTASPIPNSVTVLRQPIQEAPSDQFLESVLRIKRYIREGDVFQVNLSRGWWGRLAEGITSAQLYQRMRAYNPAPFAGLATWNGFAIISSSPERLVHIHEGIVETRPIAGTYPRNRDREMDHRLSRALMAHPKERAEHIMLIDLERNDLGRICASGTVEVDELMTLESYAHVHHIVSNIRGRLGSEATPGQVIRAVFPGGTITGCPKVRCMEIIAELEEVIRGPYTGAMGYLNRDGSADLNILIRTLCQQGDRISLRTGAGIVADSDPERELRETRYKARASLQALIGS
uniref:Anthranilate synthase component 1 n=1 Tax=Candidatus Kentrum sp. MB TaxID=2138164 RepID=A0A450XWE7_9GAMM|nr:MAG: anthranilate synthase component 1 [Candidatus Kentron sp. MB]VFK76338.1 MAG: anthranilate synthase component 1 [Candidatus Kentron sp. MB]